MPLPDWVCLLTAPHILLRIISSRSQQIAAQKIMSFLKPCSCNLGGKKEAHIENWNRIIAHRNKYYGAKPSNKPLFQPKRKEVDRVSVEWNLVEQNLMVISCNKGALMPDLGWPCVYCWHSSDPCILMAYEDYTVQSYTVQGRRSW